MSACDVCLLHCVWLCDSIDYSLPGSSVYEIIQYKNMWVGYHFLLQGIFLIHGSNPCLLCLLHWQADSLPLSHWRSPPTCDGFPVKTGCQGADRAPLADTVLWVLSHTSARELTLPWLYQRGRFQAMCLKSPWTQPCAPITLADF